MAAEQMVYASLEQQGAELLSDGFDLLTALGTALWSSACHGAGLYTGVHPALRKPTQIELDHY